MLSYEFASTETEEGGYFEYGYRPDGMRVGKVCTYYDLNFVPDGLSTFYDSNYWLDDTTWRYRYDGQNVFEEEVTYGSNETRDLTRNVLGARGIDMFETQRRVGTGSPTLVQNNFPVYDGHGNMMCQLTKSGTNSYTIGYERRYDAWVGV